MKKPLVSILIPTYNQPEFFRQSLESALSQDYPEIEIVVSDDSTDDRVEKIASEYKDRIRFLKHDTRGISIGERSLANMENLLKHAQGEFVNILFHDDLIYPTKISKMMEYFLDEDLNDQISIVSSVRDGINKHGSRFLRLDVLNDLNVYQNDTEIILSGEAVGRLILLVCGNFVGELSTVLIRREDFYRSCVRKLSPGYFLGVRDRTMWDVSTYLEICKNGSALVFLRETLSAFRMSEGDQNSYNTNLRIDILVDWLEFVVAAYLQNTYIHDKSEFGAACRYWANLVDQTMQMIEKLPHTTINIDPRLIDQISIAIDAISKQNYDVALKIGIDWIQKYSSDTFDSRYLS